MIAFTYSLTTPNLSWDTVTPTADQGAGAGEHSRRSTRSLIP
jgi:hypothetical protein